VGLCKDLVSPVVLFSLINTRGQKRVETGLSYGTQCES